MSCPRYGEKCVEIMCGSSEDGVCRMHSKKDIMYRLEDVFDIGKVEEETGINRKNMRFIVTDGEKKVIRDGIDIDDAVSQYYKMDKFWRKMVNLVEKTKDFGNHCLSSGECARYDNCVQCFTSRVAILFATTMGKEFSVPDIKQETLKEVLAELEKYDLHNCENMGFALGIIEAIHIVESKMDIEEE